ncbi:hypothetical protein L6E12_20985 [Actinokineospora sp. PR83]|uniref:hypothetical protein n=1 Tax=Actinokineospora sp. PR83 TaxID=2884908 RepID=UPI001F3C9109|nr:hypothetical protein [Actinokineospora sp. PR83]MCG8918262.1 hypothetical protein [Actinokineospora sp. PR83]
MATSPAAALAALALAHGHVAEQEALRRLAAAHDDLGDDLDAALVRLLLNPGPTGVAADLSDPTGTGAELLAHAGPLAPALLGMFATAAGPVDRARVALALEEALAPLIADRGGSTVLGEVAVAYYRQAGWTEQAITTAIAGARRAAGDQR